MLSDVGSGISLSRDGFCEILERVWNREVAQIVVTSECRFSRTGIRLLKSLLAKFDCELIALEKEGEEESLESELLSAITNELYVYGASKYSARGASSRKFTLSDDDMAMLHSLVDDGLTIQEIHKRLVEAGIRDTNKGRELTYGVVRNFISDYRKGQRAALKAQNSSVWVTESLKRFFVHECRKDSTGHARSHTATMKKRFLSFCRKNGYKLDKSHPQWFGNLLSLNGIEQEHDGKHAKIIAWELRKKYVR